MQQRQMLETKTQKKTSMATVESSLKFYEITSFYVEVSFVQSVSFYRSNVHLFGQRRRFAWKEGLNE